MASTLLVTTAATLCWSYAVAFHSHVHTIKSAASSHAPPPAVATLYLLKEAAQQTGAVCLDGSPAGVYIVRGSVSKWVVYQQGGGWCSSDENCAARANTTLGSSTTYPANSTTVMLENSYLSNDPAVNPLYDWTKVYMSYCDGSSQTTDLEAPVVYNGQSVYHRGARIIRALIPFLLNEGLAAASQVVVTGCSAGGLSTYLHADKWSAALPNASVVAMPDSGFFLNYPLSNSSYFPANTSYPWRMWWTWSHNASGALPPACLARFDPSDAWLCMFAENVAPTLTTPTFALQSYHDSYQIGSIAHLNASDPADAAGINAYGLLLAQRLQAQLVDSDALHGAALDACTHHCGPTSWANIYFDNTTSQSEAFTSWYAAPNGPGSGRALWLQNASFPCDACCKPPPA